MGNMLAILIGAVCSVLGIIALVGWWHQFIYVLQGCIGVTPVCGGLLALAIGISEMRAAKEFESAVPPATSSDDETPSESAKSEEKKEEPTEESSADGGEGEAESQ